MIGAWLKSAFDSRSSESKQLREEIIALRKVVDRRHTHLSAYARTLEIVLLAWQIPSPAEQARIVKVARERLEKAISGSAGGDGAGR